jgi:hypothetical protein
MKVSTTRGGGFGGITTRVELDSASLPPDAARELKERAKAVARAAEPPTRLPDEMHYSVTVDAITKRYSDSTIPDDVRRLIEWIDQRPERKEEISPFR